MPPEIVVTNGSLSGYNSLVLCRSVPASLFNAIGEG